MRVPREKLPAMKHEIRNILERQGVSACMRVLEHRELGERIRAHAEKCVECGDIVRELYGDKPIPVRNRPSLH